MAAAATFAARSEAFVFPIQRRNVAAWEVPESGAQRCAVGVFSRDGGGACHGSSRRLRRVGTIVRSRGDGQEVGRIHDLNGAAKSSGPIREGLNGDGAAGEVNRTAAGANGDSGSGKQAQEDIDAGDSKGDNSAGSGQQSASGGKAADVRSEEKEMHTKSARFMDDNGLTIVTDEAGRVTARPTAADAETGSETAEVAPLATSKEDTTQKNATEEKVSVAETRPDASEVKVNPEVIIAQSPGISARKSKREKKIMQEHPAPKLVPLQGFNVVLTHCTADFDTLASAVGLAKLWSNDYDPKQEGDNSKGDNSDDGESKKDAMAVSAASASSGAYQSSKNLPTFVVLPRGAHPDVQRFLALHKHLFPIKSLRSLPADLSGLNRLGLVDAQRRDRVGPAEHLISFADRVTVVDHHIDAESDIPEATDYVVDKVGSVSTMIAERLRDTPGIDVTEAEATLLALGIHADTGSLCFDSSTPRDAAALAWVMKRGASQAAIAEHAKGSLSPEQQGVLTQALINTNSTNVHGVTMSTVLLSADGFINGLAAVTQDALELSSSDVFLLCVVYDAKSHRRKHKGEQLGTRLLERMAPDVVEPPKFIYDTEAWKGGEDALRERRLRAAFDKKDTDESGYLKPGEIAAALSTTGVVATKEAVEKLMSVMDTNGDGRVCFDDFREFATTFEERQKEQEAQTGRRASTMIIIGRVKAGINTKAVNLNELFQQFGGGGHPKAASATVRLGDESEAGDILSGLVDELIETGLAKQPTVGDFMTSPVLSAKPTMTEKQVEDLFTRYDVRALPVVDDDNNVIGLVTYKEVAAAKQRLWNKEQKRLRQEAREAAEASSAVDSNRTSDKARARKNGGAKVARDRKLGSALKGWMKQHVQVIEVGTTMAEAETVLLENDVGCIPVVADGSKQLVGMVTRTDLLRQHQYYPTLHYHNKGFSDSIAARKPIIELRRRLKKFDLDE